MILSRSLLMAAVLISGSFAFAQASLPDCRARGATLSVNNDQITQWKATTKDQYHDRGHITGVIKGIYADKTGHHHIEVAMATSMADTIEVIYNEQFGPLPVTMSVGSKVEACGDYITAQHGSGGYSASPDGAILHWVHKSPSTGHESGYLDIDGVLCGWN